jgi:hypothetical protein
MDGSVTVRTWVDGAWHCVGEIADLGMAATIGVDLASGKDQTAVAVVIDGEAHSTAHLIAVLNSIFLLGASPICNPAGLLTALEPCPLVDLLPTNSVAKYGNPRPYLKRKKGRS